jgi:hypothetical protein
MKNKYKPRFWIRTCKHTKDKRKRRFVFTKAIDKQLNINAIF